MDKRFKHTELGAIPKDWSLKKFEDVITDFSAGQTPSRTKPEYFKGTIPWITSGELNYNVVTDTAEKITPEGAESAHLKLVPKGTFLMAITGLEAEGTRGSCAITGIDARTNQSTLALYPNKRMLTTEYLFHFYVAYGKRLALKYCQGTKQQSYTAWTAKQLPIILPPTVEEQSAIAEFLSNADVLIESLTALIEKMKNIKRGAMQELLTGKRRILGEWIEKDGLKSTEVGIIPEDWKVSRIGKLATITTGSKNTQDKIDDGQYPFFVRSQKVERIDTYSYDGEAVLTAGDGVGTGKVFHYVNGKFDFHQRVYKISEFDEGIYGYFFYLYLSYAFLKRVMSMTAKSSVDSVRMEMIADMPIPMPPRGEQVAISQVLSDMNSEIDALERKRDKCKQLKIGMMQQLLTGRIRLKWKN